MHLIESLNLDSLMFSCGIDIGRVAIERPDRMYCFADVTWLREELLPVWRIKLQSMPRYQNDSWNCGDFASEMQRFAIRWHATSPGHPEAGLAIAVYATREAPGLPGHYIVAAPYFVENECELWFAEPQTAEELRIPKPERIKCEGLSFR